MALAALGNVLGAEDLGRHYSSKSSATSGWMHSDQGSGIGSCVKDDAGKIRCFSPLVIGVALSG